MAKSEMWVRMRVNDDGSIETAAYEVREVMSEDHESREALIEKLPEVLRWMVGEP